MKITFLIMLVISLIIIPANLSAHQPKIAESQNMDITNPEVSKVYYSQLAGKPNTYTILSSSPFRLYVNVLVPDVAGQTKDVTANIYKDGQLVAKLSAPSGEWQRFYEPFGADNYWMGPEYELNQVSGNYKIVVSSPSNNSKYALAIGKVESVNLAESISAINTIPKVKSEFFNTSPATFLKSPLSWAYIGIMYLLAGVSAFGYRAVLRRITTNKNRQRIKNIGSKDRWLRIAIGLVLLIWAITTSWSPFLLFFSGFAFCEALFSWCGFYAALGKNTCPL